MLGSGPRVWNGYSGDLPVYTRAAEQDYVIDRAGGFANMKISQKLPAGCLGATGYSSPVDENPVT